MLLFFLCFFLLLLIDNRLSWADAFFDLLFEFCFMTLVKFLFLFKSFDLKLCLLSDMNPVLFIVAFLIRLLLSLLLNYFCRLLT